MAVTEYVISYVITLKNAGLSSVLRADISQYLRFTGVSQKECERGINEAIRTKRLIPLKNGKLTLNPRNK